MLKRVMEFIAPNGMRLIVANNSDPRNVQMFHQVIDRIVHGK